MDILDKMAQRGGEPSGARQSKRTDYQLHYAMYLYLDEYLKDENSDFRVILDFDDDISLIKNNKVSFYQVKTSDILATLSDILLSGTHSDYLVNLYKHIQELDAKDIEQLYLVSNVKFSVSGKLLKEVALKDFSEKPRTAILDKIKERFKVPDIDTSFLAITSCITSDLPLDSFTTHIKGKVQDVIDAKAKDSKYGQGSLYDCLKTYFDKQNNFDDFSKVKNGKTLSNFKGIDTDFLQRIIRAMKSKAYENIDANYKKMLEDSGTLIPSQIRQAAISFANVQRRFLIKDDETLRLYKRAQTIMESHKKVVSNKFEFLEQIRTSTKLFSSKDVYETRAIIFVAYEVYSKGDII